MLFFPGARTVKPPEGQPPAATTTPGAARIASEASARTLLRQLFDAAIAAARGDELISRHSTFARDVWRYARDDISFDWHLPATGRVLVVGAGKAAASLARGLEQVLGDRIDDGLVIVKYGHVEPLRRIRIVEAGHPVPDASGEAATLRMLQRLSGLRADDRVFVLLTGGASSLLVAPREGMTLADKATITQTMLRSGMSIEEMNVVRMALSRVKGGKLLEAIAPAQSLTLAISDIPTGEPGLIGSGPTLPNRHGANDALAVLARHSLLARIPQHVRALLEQDQARAPRLGDNRFVVLADSGQSLTAVERHARELGCRTRVVDARMQGETHSAATSFARLLRAEATALRPGEPPVVLMAAGETTLTVRGNGVGGRNQEFALVAARELAGTPRAVLLAAGTDGTDGPTEAAGAYADGTTLNRAAATGIDANAALANNDSHHFFARIDDTLDTGPTGTNVMDLVIGVAFPPA